MNGMEMGWLVVDGDSGTETATGNGVGKHERCMHAERMNASLVQSVLACTAVGQSPKCHGSFSRKNEMHITEYR